MGRGGDCRVLDALGAGRPGFRRDAGHLAVVSVGVCGGRVPRTATRRRPELRPTQGPSTGRQRGPHAAQRL